MKMNVEILKRSEETETIEAEFPAYSYHALDGDTYDSELFARMDTEVRNGTKGFLRTVIHRTRHMSGFESYEFEAEFRRLILPRDAAYYLGMGEYACTKERFEAERQKAREWLNKHFRFGP